MMKIVFIGLFAALAVLVYIGYSPIREFYKIPVYKGKTSLHYPRPNYDPKKKTIFLVAHNKGTEIFDLITPFYLFNLTKQANVFIIAQKKEPIAVMKGFFVLPHYILSEIDSLGIRSSAIVIPNLPAMDRMHPDPALINWIREKHSDSTSILSVCAGSFTAAATGLYDGKIITTHASDMKDNKKHYSKPRWITGVTVTRSGNLYSTAGVSNAVEGSLVLIRDLFGEASMKAVMDSIHYPHNSLKSEHQSIPISAMDKAGIIKNVLLKKNPNIGVLLQDDIDEFDLSAILDAYHRTFPSSLKAYAVHKNTVTTKFGLTLLPTGEFSDIDKVDELHVLSPNKLSQSHKALLNHLRLVSYNSQSKEYIFDECLRRISTRYGNQVQTIAKRLLDYN